MLKMIRTSLLFCGLAFSFASTSQAFLEIKGSYSLLATTPDQFNNYNNTLPKIEQLKGAGGEVLLNFSAMPIGIGARYEVFEFKETNSAGTHFVEFTRVSAVLNKRFIDTGFYFGPIITIGLSNEFKDKLTQEKASSSLSGSIGLETGIKFGFLMFGIEGGYLVAPLGDLKSATGTTVTNNSQPVKVDFSGVYGRGVLGLNF